jgi:hypothetical protein
MLMADPRSISDSKIHGRREDSMPVSPVGRGAWSAQTAPRTQQPMTNTADPLDASNRDRDEDLRSGKTPTSLASQEAADAGSPAAGIESHFQLDPLLAGPATLGTPPSQPIAGTAEGTLPAATAADQRAIPLGGPTSARAEKNLASLANQLGTDPDALLAQLNARQGISPLRAAGRDAAYGRSILDSNTGGIMVDQYA